MSNLIPFLLLLGTASSDAPQISPVPLPVVTESVREWTFNTDTASWHAWNNCVLSTNDGCLQIRCTGNDPYFGAPVSVAGGDLLLEMKIRGNGKGPGSVYWTTDQSPRFGEDKVHTFPLTHNGGWQDATVRITVPGMLRSLRIDPGQGPGDVEIASIRLLRQRVLPLVLERIDLDQGRLRVKVKNRTSEIQSFTIFGQTRTIAGGAELVIDRTVPQVRPLERVDVELICPGFPPLRRTLFACHPDAQSDWITRQTPAFTLRVAADGSAAFIHRAGRLAAVLAPLVHSDGVVPELKLIDDTDTLRFGGDGVSVSITCADKELSLSIDSTRACEGPVVRVPGSLAQGLFAGLEYLGQGEPSSSTRDIETPEHLRFAPDPLLVTMPLMAFVTDRASVAMTWKDMTLQPTFATPNFFDGSADHRLALRGQKIEATLLVDDVRVEETIFWAVKRHGLPPLPAAPRTPDQQRALYLAALHGPLKTESGWGHCVEERWARQPFADMASTIWRLTGEVPDFREFVPGGAHVPNGTIYFVTGRAQQWLDYQRHQAEHFVSQQQPDGSFRYDGRFRRGHFEDTAVGVCARPAAVMLEYVRLTGDAEVLAAACRTLDYMKRFDVPRGAQVWEIPLHTPDQLASAYAVWAYVRGYELTRRDDYLAEARRWALSGIPFVYLWGRYPVMSYGTPPVFGATNWVAPVWIGLPVQWVGGVYAYALTMLAPHDKSVDWMHLAEGILVAAQQMQYSDGPHAGLLPDSFDLASQQRRPWNINPCALVSLQLALEGGCDFLAVACDGRHRIAAPFPVTIQDGKAIVRGKSGLDYQVILDGRVVDVKSRGEDMIDWE